MIAVWVRSWRQLCEYRWRLRHGTWCSHKFLPSQHIDHGKVRVCRHCGRTEFV